MIAASMTTTMMRRRTVLLVDQYIFLLPLWPKTDMMTMTILSMIYPTGTYLAFMLFVSLG